MRSDSGAWTEQWGPAPFFAYSTRGAGPLPAHQRSAIDGDDGANPGYGSFQWSLDADSKRREPCRTRFAGALHRDADDSLIVDGYEFDIPPVGHERRADAIEPGLDDFAGRRQIIRWQCRHGDLIGLSAIEIDMGDRGEGSIALVRASTRPEKVVSEAFRCVRVPGARIELHLVRG